MPLVLHLSEPRFLFFWNHKVASSSLLQGLRGEFPHLRVYAQSGFRLPQDDAEWPRFMIVRDPLARTASCYRNKCQDALEALARNGSLEPCQKHLLKALGGWPCPPKIGAQRLSELSFSQFVELLPSVRDGNSHFRLQIDVLRHAESPPSWVSWAVGNAATLLHLGRTHFVTPQIFKARPDPVRDRALLSRVRQQKVHWIRLEKLSEEWPEVEKALGREIPLSWQVRTGEGEDWRDLYDPVLRNRVADLYGPDMEMFGYGPDLRSGASDQKV